MKNKSLLGLFLAVLILSGCKQDNKPKRDTPVSGHIHLAVDDAYRNLAENVLGVFHETYSNAQIDVDYVSETEAINRLLLDSARVIIIGRKLNEAENVKFVELKYGPKYTQIALDAVAVIVHPSNPTEMLDLDQLRNILTGKQTKWSDNKDIRIVLDHPGSGIYAYLRDSILGSNEKGDNLFALNNNQEVVDYVAENKNSIGFIGVNMISNFDESANQQFLEKVKPLLIAKSANDKGYEPYQAYIATRYYPLTRNVYVIINEPYNGLGSGLGAFVASDKGQRIILKDGLVPATQPVRLVEINPDQNPFNK